ncbi:DUF1109 domain-containing protein [Sphingomonas sp. PAMC 26605]|uniref:DUF1109 domain-containing protein n=1 Tax=Sphingomonas sp. PAMC 26605 TaxID=1112214 RepID=UPI0004953D6E|nr:DUF1109 domain-containing protein [Sphingomonas sp. PAMC 26605]
MNTEELIDMLSRDVPRVPRHAVVKRVGVGIVAGGLVAMLLAAAALGIRPDLRVAIHGFSFWMKWGYTISLALGATYVVTRIARPAPLSLRGLWLMTAPVLVLASIGVGELVRTPPSDWLQMWLGRSWTLCPWLVLTLAAPIFTGLVWSFRKLAPTRLRAAGAITGLSAGAWAATIYCLHCPEVSAIFVLTWYTLGVLLAAAIGALIGPGALRW